MHELSALFLRLAREAQLDTGLSEGTPVVPVIVGDARLCIQLSQKLLEQGFNVRPLLPPAVEENAARLRFFITCEHTEEQIQSAVRTTKMLLAEEKSHAGNGKSRIDVSTPTQVWEGDTPVEPMG